MHRRGVFAAGIPAASDLVLSPLADRWLGGDRAGGAGVVRRKRVRRSGPVDRRLTLRGQVIIRARERLAAEEALVRGERRWVRRGNHQMLAAVDQRPLGDGVAAPQDEDDM